MRKLLNEKGRLAYVWSTYLTLLRNTKIEAFSAMMIGHWLWSTLLSPSTPFIFISSWILGMQILKDLLIGELWLVAPNPISQNGAPLWRSFKVETSLDVSVLSFNMILNLHHPDVFKSFIGCHRSNRARVRRYSLDNQKSRYLLRLSSVYAWRVYTRSSFKRGCSNGISWPLFLLSGQTLLSSVAMGRGKSEQN